MVQRKCNVWIDLCKDRMDENDGMSRIDRSVSWMDGWTDGLVFGWMVTDRLMVGWMDRLINSWMDG